MTDQVAERLTESEWEMLRLRRTCSYSGHNPAIFTNGELAAICLCGDVVWTGAWTKKASSE